MSEESLRAELKRNAEAMRTLKRENEKLRKENAELKSGGGGAAGEPPADVRFVVSPKGALSVYGLGGVLPTTLYRDQWARLLSASGALAQFLKAQAGALRDTPEPAPPKPRKMKAAKPKPKVEEPPPVDDRQQVLRLE